MYTLPLGVASKASALSGAAAETPQNPAPSPARTLPPVFSGAVGLTPGNLPTGVVPPGETARRLGAQLTEAERAVVELAAHLERPAVPVNEKTMATRLHAVTGREISRLEGRARADRPKWRSLQDVLQSVSADSDSKLTVGQSLALASQLVDNLPQLDRAWELSSRVPIALSPAEQQRLNQNQSVVAFQFDPQAHLNEMIVAARRRPELTKDLLTAAAAGTLREPEKAILAVGPGALPWVVAELGSGSRSSMLMAADCLGACGRLAQQAAPALLEVLARTELETDRARLLTALATIGGPVAGLNEALIQQTVRSLEAGGPQRAAAWRVILAMAPAVDPRQTRALPRADLEVLLPHLGASGWHKVDLVQLYGCEPTAIQELGPPPLKLADQLLESALNGRFSPLVRYGLERGPASHRRAAVERLLKDPPEFVRNGADLSFATNLAKELPKTDELRGRIVTRLIAARDNQEEPGLRKPAFSLLLSILPMEAQCQQLQLGLQDPALQHTAAQQILHYAGQALPHAQREQLLQGILQTAVDPDLRDLAHQRLGHSEGVRANDWLNHYLMLPPRDALGASPSMLMVKSNALLMTHELIARLGMGSKMHDVGLIRALGQTMQDVLPSTRKALAQVVLQKMQKPSEVTWAADYRVIERYAAGL